MSKAKEQAKAFADAAAQYGFSWEARGSVVTISATFAPGDKEAFTRLDMMAGSVLALAPLKGGSVWGTDGGSVGGYSALTHGKFVMNKSGENGKNFTNALIAMKK